MAYRPNDDMRNFSQLYGVRRLKNSYIPNDIQICISTPSGQFSNYNRIQLGQLSSCVLCLKLPLDFYTLCITLNRPYPNLLPEAF